MKQSIYDLLGSDVFDAYLVFLGILEAGWKGFFWIFVQSFDDFAKKSKLHSAYQKTRMFWGKERKTLFKSSAIHVLGFQVSNPSLILGEVIILEGEGMEQ